MSVVVSYAKGKAKVYLHDGRQSPKLDPKAVAAWIERHA